MSLDDLLNNGVGPKQITKYLNGLVIGVSPEGNAFVKRELSRAVDIFPDNIFFKGIMAKYLIKIKDYDAALRVLERKLLLAPNNVVGLGLQAQALIGKGDYDAALRIAPNDVVGLGLQAQAFIGKGDYDAALSVLERKLLLAPNDVVGLGLQAQALIGKGDYDAALRIAPNDVVGLGLQVQALIGKGDYDAALSILERKLSLAPNNVVGLGLQAQALIGKGDYDAALRVAPNNVVGHYMKAAIFFGIGESTDKVIENITQIIKLPYVNQKTQFNALALLYAVTSSDNPLVIAIETSVNPEMLTPARERSMVIREERNLPLRKSTLMNSFWEISTTFYLNPVNQQAVNDVFRPYCR